MNNEMRKENDNEKIGIQRLLSPRQVAEILGISVKTVHKLVRETKLACVQVTAKERRFTEEQVKAYIEAQSKGLPRCALTGNPLREYHLLPRKGVRNRLGICGQVSERR